MPRSSKQRWWDKWQMQHLSIGQRLRLVFACIMLLMFAGSSLALWDLREVRRQIERVSLVEQRMGAVLHVDNTILSLMNELQRAADTRQRDRFEAEATRLLADLRSDPVWATDALRGSTSDNGRQGMILSTLHELWDHLPVRIQSLVELARQEDWIVLHARLLNQADHTDEVLAVLVREIDKDLSETRNQLVEGVESAQRRMTLKLAATGFLSLLFAAFLGLVVTRSITRPLANLDSAARRLALGQFGYQVSVTGNDELSQLESVFNQTTQALERLYNRLGLSEAQFRSLIESASDLIMVVNRIGHITYASPSCRHVLGYSSEQLIGQPIRNMLHTEDLPLADQIFDHNPPGNKHPFELRFRHSDGRFRVMEGVATSLLDDPAVDGIVVNARDITERQEAQLALRQRDDQLRQSQKMEAVGRLAGGVAHDFNNLLTVINGYSEFLMEQMEAGDPRRRYVKDIRDAGDRAVELTRQLLAFSRKQILQPQLLDLNEVIRDAERMLRRVIGEDIALVCDLDSAAGFVQADRNQLHQVLINLAVNARDAMPRGGELTVKTAGASDVSLCAGGTTSRGPYTILTVTDTGHGMDEATRQRVFEPFFTTKEQGKGTGLGLSTVYGIVEQSGGHISVQSELGRGTTFQICLPQGERPSETEREAQASVLAGGTETVLVVEDQDEVRRFAAASLTSYGYRVMEAANGDEALRLATSCKEPIHVLLTDVVMPGMNGVELSRELLVMRPDLKVVFASGYADSVILRHGILDQGVTFLPKPYSSAALAAKIRAAADCSNPSGPPTLEG